MRKTERLDERAGERRFPRPGRVPREDTAAVMKFYGLPGRFPKAVLDEVAKLPSAPAAADIRGRLDLRRRYIFTCDPVSARDYDDALSIETDKAGNRVLGVHIADVSHYVKTGSAIDREAYKRGTSVYFCDRVVPMLPEALSNGVCSLVPGEDRLAFSVFITFDRNGEAVKRSFAKSVIRSAARFAYEDVMRVIEGEVDVADRTGAKAGKKGISAIRKIAALARQLRAKRFAEGALDLETAETEILLDRYGEIESISVSRGDESHQMVEECMVAANEAVAKELWTRGVKILARLHEPPDEEKILALRAELRGLGIKAGNLENRKVFAGLLQTIKRHPLHDTLSMMVLRSMKKAVYDASTIGHFGLAKRYYAHFTSPIRRYPDLTLHRQLADFICGRDARVAPGLLARRAEHLSEREEIAAEAERALVEIKRFRFFERQMEEGRDEIYDAVVSKVMPFGCFVDIPSLAASGLVHVSALSRRFLRYSESDASLSAGRGECWRAGDRLKVRVARVDFDGRKIDFVPAERGRGPRERRRRK